MADVYENYKQGVKKSDKQITFNEELLLSKMALIISKYLDSVSVMFQLYTLLSKQNVNG